MLTGCLESAVALDGLQFHPVSDLLWLGQSLVALSDVDTFALVSPEVSVFRPSSARRGLYQLLTTF